MKEKRQSGLELSLFGRWVLGMTLSAGVGLWSFNEYKDNLIMNFE
jgi:hypothetical protein